MIIVEIAIQKVDRPTGRLFEQREPETILSVAFNRDSLPEALADVKQHLDLLVQKGEG